MIDTREVIIIRGRKFEFNRFTVELGNIFSNGARINSVFYSKRDILSSKFFASLTREEQDEIISRLD